MGLPRPESPGPPYTYNETLFYRILKTAVDANGNPIAGHAQNIWIMKPSESQGDDTLSGFDVMKYIDTQVKYGQAYEYQVFAYQLVVGSKYNFQFTHALNHIMQEDYNEYPEEDVFEEDSPFEEGTPVVGGSITLEDKDFQDSGDPTGTDAEEEAVEMTKIFQGEAAKMQQSAARVREGDQNTIKIGGLDVKNYESNT
jgi:hypothetical protein